MAREMTRLRLLSGSGSTAFHLVTVRAEGGGNEPSGGAQLDFELDRQRDRAGVCHDAHTAPAYRELCVGAVRLLGAFAAAGGCDVGCVGVYEPVACCKPAWINIYLKQKKRHPPPRQRGPTAPAIPRLLWQ